MWLFYKPYKRVIFLSIRNTEKEFPFVIFSMRYYRHRQLLKDLYSAENFSA